MHFPSYEGFLFCTQMRAHLNRTSTGHQLPSSPSLHLCSHDARLQRGEAGHPMQLWEAEIEVRKTTAEEEFHLNPK